MFIDFFKIQIKQPIGDATGQESRSEIGWKPTLVDIHFWLIPAFIINNDNNDDASYLKIKESLFYDAQL